MVRKSISDNNEIKKGLYLVSTPIGNLNDITLRAINILKKSDYILCEDTRISKILLDNFKIRSKLISNHKFNETKNLFKILGLLNNNLIISLVSDAGTPGISDPGATLVKKCVEEKIDIFPIPGPSSVISAVSMSGFSEKFFFYGFLPEKKKILEEDLNNLSKISTSIVFFVSSKKIKKFVPFIKKNFSGRKIVICREMTKYYEEFIRFKIDEIDTINLDLKGELTVVISEKEINKKTSQTLDESDKRIISKMINKLSIKEIVNLISRDKKISKKIIYNYCIKIKNEK
tara:strand:- start:1703 stop:2566 length:864 start_codon:yes stop_codon:yes gene_type:complete